MPVQQLQEQLKEWIATHAEITFARSSGAGGQNVNKVSTKVVARLPIDTLPFLTSEEKERIKKRLANQINKEGELVVHVQQERTQFKNRVIAISRLQNLVLNGLRKEKRRIKTLLPAAENEKRLEQKKRRGEKKKSRHFDW